MKLKITHNQLRKIIKEELEMSELDFDSLKNDENLEELRHALERGRVASIAFVKKNGEVRHMNIRKTLSSYVPSEKPKTPAQRDININNNLMTVVDVNAFKAAKKELGNAEDAAKKAFRRVSLENVLGFLVGGNFIDVREENQIRERFGEEVYNSLTKSMVAAMERDAVNAEEEV